MMCSETYVNAQGAGCRVTFGGPSPFLGQQYHLQTEIPADSRILEAHLSHTWVTHMGHKNNSQVV